MPTVRVIYDYEPEGWSAESPDRPRWTAFGETLEEVRDLAHEGLSFFIGEDAQLDEFLTDHAANHIFSARRAFNFAPSEHPEHRRPRHYDFHTRGQGKILRSHGAVRVGA